MTNEDTSVATASRRTCVALLAALASGASVEAGAAEPGRDSPAAAAVRGFLHSLEQPDATVILGFCAPDAQVCRLRGGELVVSKLADVVRSMSSGYGNLAQPAGASRFSEPVEDVGARSFDRIATVWTRYRAFIDGKLHHSGHTLFSLVELHGRWLIANITDEATRTYA